MSNSKNKKEEERLNINLTFILVLQEVIVRIMTEEIDNSMLKRMLKKDFNIMFNYGKKLNESYRKFIRKDDRLIDPEEAYDTESDYMFDMVKATSNLDSEEKWKAAIAAVKGICNK